MGKESRADEGHGSVEVSLPDTKVRVDGRTGYGWTPGDWYGVIDSGRPVDMGPYLS